jgi:hypothetical protein
MLRATEAPPWSCSTSGHGGQDVRGHEHPHMYAIDKAGVLVYAGAIDDRPTSRKGDVRGPQLRARRAPGGDDEAAGEDAGDPGLRLHREVL